MKKEIIDWGRTIAMVLVLFLGIQTVAFASFHIPSESMAPTLAVGDRVVVTKFPFGFSKNSIPFNLGSFLPETKSRLFQAVPKRGDIVVFKHTRDSKTMIKRVIGLPGDSIAMTGGKLFLNGTEVERKLSRTYTFTSRHGQSVPVTEYTETLPEGLEHLILEITNTARLDNMREITVPEGHVFMMGDNRDMSADSRETFNLGPVPIANLMGRAEFISYSLKNCGKRNPDICNSSRILKGL
jgi:signal peptidase I